MLIFDGMSVDGYDAHAQRASLENTGVTGCLQRHLISVDLWQMVDEARLSLLKWRNFINKVDFATTSTCTPQTGFATHGRPELVFVMLAPIFVLRSVILA